jgi:hypothetical protein
MPPFTDELQGNSLIEPAEFGTAVWVFFRRAENEQIGTSYTFFGGFGVGGFGDTAFGYG